MSLWDRVLLRPMHWGGRGARELPRAPVAVEKPHHCPWGLEGWGEAAETLWLQKPCGCRKMSAIPVISRGPAGGKQQGMPAASSYRSQGCCVPEDTPHPKTKEAFTGVLQPGGSEGHQKSQEQHCLALLFFPALLLQASMLKSRQK